MSQMPTFQGRWPVLEAGLLNPDLDLDHYARVFARDGRVQIDNVLRPEVADFLHQVLDQQVPWHLAYRDSDGSHELPPQQWQQMDAEQRRRLEQQILAQADDAFQFYYLTYMMVSAYLERRDPDLPLNRMVELLNRADWLQPMRRITGFEHIVRANAQATCYRAGHFLTLHNDSSNKEHRLTAYVLNLARDWRSDWGGLLQFIDDDDRVTETLMPRFNTLSMFRTPAMHCVSPVAQYARGSRYTITGWLLTREQSRS
ncbi:MAG: 2OG-Fe(II) oxygenase family protein [Wenzhouxiangellaceae bacterium]